MTPTVREGNLEERFEQAMLELYRRALKEAHYNARLFLQMVGEHGGLATARKLITDPKPASGFEELWEAGRLDLTVEKRVLDPEFEPLFSAEERQLAARRLEQYGYVPPA